MRVLTLSLMVLLAALVSSQQTVGQNKTQPSDDVVRTRTELVQTDVTVVDKRGRFVENLSAADFGCALIPSFNHSRSSSR
jgi:hypothetical protein